MTLNTKIILWGIAVLVFAGIVSCNNGVANGCTNYWMYTATVSFVLGFALVFIGFLRSSFDD